MGGIQTDFYVDQSADAATCTFRTIADALVVAKASNAPTKTIHLAQGTYSGGTGESFPIELRDGISLVGAGAGRSVLVGTGPVSTRPPSNAFGSLTGSLLTYGTLVVGEATKAVAISGLSILPNASPFAGTEAIICDRGNAAPSAPKPNTTIRDISISGFEVGIRVTWSSPPSSGCNAFVSASVFENGRFGVVADGLMDQSGVSPQFVSVQLGDGTPDGGNAFRNLSINDPNVPAYFNGAGLTLSDAVTGVVVRGNRFMQDGSGVGNIGIWAVSQQLQYDFPGLDVEGNEFGPLANAGIALFGRVVVSRLVDNSFHDISMSSYPGLGFLGTALALYADDPSSPAFPAVTYARHNRFFGNDIGLHVRSFQTPLPSDRALQNDFGTAIDPGGNTFRCNSAPQVLQGSGPGGDVLIDVPENSSITIPFLGNVWDHTPPTVWIGDSPNGASVGTDVYLYKSSGLGAAVSGPNVDATDASFADAPACPVGRLAGP